MMARQSAMLFSTGNYLVEENMIYIGLWLVLESHVSLLPQTLEITLFVEKRLIQHFGERLLTDPCPCRALKPTRKFGDQRILGVILSNAVMIEHDCSMFLLKSVLQYIAFFIELIIVPVLNRMVLHRIVE